MNHVNPPRLGAEPYKNVGFVGVTAPAVKTSERLSV